MKKTSKVLLIVLCAALLVIGSVLGTIAYLTDTQTVQNTFTIGQVKISLHETKIDGETGKPVEGEGAGITDSGNTEIKLIPGREITKDPTVTVLEGSEDCYVRAFVKVTWPSDANSFFRQQEYKGWFDFSEDWTAEEVYIGNVAGDLIELDIYELRYKEKVTKSEGNTELPALFTKITVDPKLTNEEIASIDNSEVIVIAQAIQAEGFDDADAAWAAVEYPEELGLPNAGGEGGAPEPAPDGE